MGAQGVLQKKVCCEKIEPSCHVWNAKGKYNSKKWKKIFPKVQVGSGSCMLENVLSTQKQHLSFSPLYIFQYVFQSFTSNHNSWAIGQKCKFGCEARKIDIV